VVDPALAARLRARAEAAGRDPGDLLDEAVARYLDNGTALAPATPATTPDDH
jgi:hypothetical protein